MTRARAQQQAAAAAAQSSPVNQQPAPATFQQQSPAASQQQSPATSQQPLTNNPQSSVNHESSASSQQDAHEENDDEQNDDNQPPKKKRKTAPNKKKITQEQSNNLCHIYAAKEGKWHLIEQDAGVQELLKFKTVAQLQRHVANQKRAKNKILFPDQAPKELRENIVSSIENAVENGQNPDTMDPIREELVS